MKNSFIRKSVYLEILENIYKNVSLDYLIALRDGLSIIIKQKAVGGFKPYENYFKGYVKYI